MGFLCGCVYSCHQDRYFLFDDPKEMVAKLNGNFCVSFNGLNFDTRLLLGNNRRWKMATPFFQIVSRETIWFEYDLFLVVLASFHKIRLGEATKRRSPGGLNLNDLCKNTLKKSKIDIDLKKSALIQTIEYNINDVRITRFLFEHLTENGFVKSPKCGKVDIPRQLRESAREKLTLVALR
jgi:hypothetical protein